MAASGSGVSAGTYRSTAAKPESVVRAFYSSTDPAVCNLLTPHGLKQLEGQAKPRDTPMAFCRATVGLTPLTHVTVRVVSASDTTAVVRVSFQYTTPKKWRGCSSTQNVGLLKRNGRWLNDSFKYWKKQPTCPSH
jgi:hypothetical protein